jgi:hypothetical protein
MSLSIEQIIMLIIFLIVLVVLVIFTQIPNFFGNQVNLQQELRRCCQAFIASGCPNSFPGIQCNSKDLSNLVKEVGLVDSTGNPDINQTKRFCNCPLNKTFRTTIP